MVKFCVALSNMLQLESDIEMIKATFELKVKDTLQSLCRYKTGMTVGMIGLIV